MYTRDVRNVVLVAAANGAIAGIRRRKLWPDDPVFQFCQECVFVDGKNTVVAADPDAWIDRVRSEFDGVRLREPKRWHIEAVKADGAEVWEGSEEIGDSTASDRRIWRAGFRRVATHANKQKPAERPPAELIAALDQTLEEIASFAKAEKIDNFQRLFEEGRAALHTSPRHDPLFTLAEFGTEAKQLWCALGPAWVFGGMGSWNDMGFDGASGEMYSRLTGALSSELNEAIMAVANSTWPRHKAPPAPAQRGWWQRLFGDS